MEKKHPEVEEGNPLEPTIGEQLRLADFNNKLEKLDRAELLEIAKLLAKQALVTQPSAIRFLAREPAQNLVNPATSDRWRDNAKQISDALRGGLQEEE
mgnify:CR=1 FL=1